MRKHSVIGIAGAAIAFASVAGTGRAEEDDDQFILRHPAAFCSRNSNSDGLGASNTTSLRNSTGHPVSIFCPLLSDGGQQFERFYAYKIGSVSCTLRISSCNAGQWVYNPTDVAAFSGYDIIVWELAVAPQCAAALECVMQGDGSLMTAYEAFTNFTDLK
jgi:hypothetical protein